MDILYIYIYIYKHNIYIYIHVDDFDVDAGMVHTFLTAAGGKRDGTSEVS